MDRLKLSLYIRGKTVQSNRAFSNLKKFCENHFRDQYDLEVVDILEAPERAAQDNVLVTPVLIRKSPLPVKYAVGDLGNEEQIKTILE